MASRLRLMADARYEGRPFLRLLECYVLWTIGELSTDQSEQLVAMTPNLRETYGFEGDWQTIVAHQMDFPSELLSSLREMWERNLKVADVR